MTRVACGLGLVLLLLPSCGGSGSGGGGTLLSVSGPLESAPSTVFVLHGTGFLAAGPSAQARFTATSGTPFASGSSATAVVDVEVVSDTTALGASPICQAAGTTAAVELLLANGATLADPAVVAGFLPRYSRLLEPDDDIIQGGPANEVFHGGVGYDSLRGGGGDDQLYGEADDDFLDGEAGNDLLEGGPGQDWFAISPVPGDGTDTMTDLVPTTDGLVLVGVPAVPATFALIASVSDAGPGGNVVLTWTGGGTLTLQGVGTGSIDSLAALVDAGVKIVILP